MSQTERTPKLSSQPHAYGRVPHGIHAYAKQFNLRCIDCYQLHPRNMAFSRTRTDRPESLLFRPPQSPRDDPSLATFATPLSPLRSLASRVTPTLPPSSDVRGSLQRRFTTNALPTLAPIGEQRKQALQAMEQWDNSQLVSRSVHLLCRVEERPVRSFKSCELATYQLAEESR